jgi:hypothetical protein
LYGTEPLFRALKRVLPTQKAGIPVKYIIEIFKRSGADVPQVMYTFAHTASSIDLVRESVHSALTSINWPTDVNGFRIVSGEGVELYNWSK